VYARTLPDGTRLVALRQEVPKERAYVDKHGNPRAPIPGAVYPPQVFEYTFQLQSADGGVKRVLGSKMMGLYPGEVERMKFSLYDASIFDGHLVVLYHSGRHTLADITEDEPRGSRFVMEDDSLIVMDAPESGGFAIGGRLEGSLKAGDLHAIVTTHVPGKTADRQFLLTKKDGGYKWVLDPPPAHPVELPIRLTN